MPALAAHVGMVDAQVLNFGHFKSGSGGTKTLLVLRHADHLARPTAATDLWVDKYSLHDVPLNLTI
jgi:hypothetical protein